MSRYEVLILAIPEITQDEVTALESQLQNVIKKTNAIQLSFERWGKYRLAYPVKKNSSGIYFLVRFEIGNNPEVVLDGIRSLLAVDLRNVVMRYVVSVLDAQGSLEYRRPPSLEETPPKEATSFGRGEGRGRGGFSRGPRGARGEHDRGGGRRREYQQVSVEEELDLGNDMSNEGAE